MKWKRLLGKLSTKTAICKICFKPIKTTSFYYLFGKNHIICEECIKKLNAKFIKFKIAKFKGLAIYEYDENIKSLLYQFKGCYDYELASIFLSRFSFIFHCLYYDYYIVPIPSYYIDDERRGFNHVVEIFKILNLPILNVIKKTDHYKQSDQNKENRKEIIKHLKLSNIEKIKNKKILIVDDVLTTGNSIRSAIELIKPHQPKDIRVLVISKVKFEKEKFESI